MLRHVVVGDVHGCLEELKALLDPLALGVEDRLVFVGDLIDKGPDSAGVVRYVRELAQRVPTTVVLGNHEEKHLRFVSRGRPEENEVQLEDDLNEWLANVCQLYHKFKGANGVEYVVVHAGFHPAFFEQYGELPPLNLLPHMSRKVQDRASRFCRIRFVNPEGQMVSLGEEKPEDVYWTSLYEGWEGIALYGHQHYEDVEVSDYALGLDTGCVYGGKLTAMVVDAHGVKWRSVPALRQYVEPRIEN